MPKRFCLYGRSKVQLSVSTGRTFGPEFQTVLLQYHSQTVEGAVRYPNYPYVFDLFVSSYQSRLTLVTFRVLQEGEADPLNRDPVLFLAALLVLSLPLFYLLLFFVLHSS